MAITAGVGSNSAANTGSSVNLTLTGCTAGRALVIAYTIEGTVTLSSLTCSGESVTLLGSLTEINLDATPISIKGQMGYIKQLAGSGDKTLAFTFSGSTTYYVYVEEIQGQDTTTFEDGGTISATANEQDDGNISAGNITTTYTNSGIFIVQSSHGNNPTLTVDGSGITRTVNSVGNEGYRHSYHYLDAGAAGSKAVAGTVSNFGRWGLVGFAVKASGSGSGGGVSKSTRLTMLGIG